MSGSLRVATCYDVAASRSLYPEIPTAPHRRFPTRLPPESRSPPRLEGASPPAIKLQMAQLYYINAHTEEILKPLIDAAIVVDSFTHLPLDTAGFIRAMQERRAEFNDFYLDLVKINRSDEFFWQRIYACAA